ncbi:23S rRNA (guanine2445-N2)-methyltransferase / 23S rRNA (guanine2069-N7)-methyltransferase [Moraxella cuniculi DSM 21768]|uniref:23S rRNA (Guanine2445-N2)-methyltransferase / 23S rRNA (Guanine2069-N7)-methyltransferase n=1 Tax=Moraxella cuniculi DSM 21768 TaxID=1122245 RepID=A0A1N7EWU6_9GAMM|nr:bifunctional 23S rRNA (guanine(2069)-N(7))-methyltransferase RlmK/23S rRNA (guanine(2445)-N(2))-methyltransferase RlmL [Moraxella cuniculi]SIR92618.1 23S rRNA (guanine2445-N2)-methyltransferase / 23S rRNA (guanine2069-N7)-methyltransferase [Moraxella cuniculi DSM 21768]
MSLAIPAYFANLTQFCADDFYIIITCADGLEAALCIELESFELAPQILRAGRVLVRIDLTKLYHICLYSRVASRVLLPLGEYHFKQKITDNTEVPDEDIPQALYQFARRIDWTALFGLEHRFAVRLSTDKRLTVNQQFATLRIKDAIADTFNHAFAARPDVDAKSPDFQIFATANQKVAELFLDLSGTSLHRRGYRVANTAAPLKENLAAALLYECNWHTGEFDAIIDPMCGSGTFISEALLMRAGYPVGIDKASREFGFYAWQHHNESLWLDMVAAANDDFHARLAKLQQQNLTIVALDADAQAIRACHKNLLAAGLGCLLPSITLQQQALHHLPRTLAALPELAAKNPLIITNPPYGERLGELDFIKPLYQGLGLISAEALRQAGVQQAYMAVLASQVEQADTLPILSPHTLRCHNGALTVYFRHGELNLAKLPSLIGDWQKQHIVHEEAQEFVNRLQKNLSNLKNKANKYAVSNLRVYDADLPNFNVAIDVYGDKIHVQEYAPPKQIPADVAKMRFNLVLQMVREVFGVSRETIFIKTRAKQSGNEQYTKTEHGKRRKLWLAREDGAYFYVNFTDYLDTGLFIDHRTMRGLVKSASRGKRVLNLFAYTCSASVHAALAGAKQVTSVDLSANYLDWGKQNFALNGLLLDAIIEDKGEYLPKYQFIAADVFEWIKHNTEQFEVIFIDPPTFSNSKKFKGTFDVQRDHAALINRAMNRLSADGVLYFSNNFSKFELDEALMARYEIVQITHKTIGFDFNSKKPIHQSYEIRHKNAPVRDFVDERVLDKTTRQELMTYQDSKQQDSKQRQGAKRLPQVKESRSKNRPTYPRQANKTQSKQQPSQSGTKRVYINPKAADGANLAKKLNDKLNIDTQNLSEKRYSIKAKTNTTDKQS